MFLTAKYTRSVKPNDAMYLWLENVSSGGFEVCIREFLSFDGKHQDTIVVSKRNLENKGGTTLIKARSKRRSINAPNLNN